MWAVNGTDLAMTEGDWGVALPITVSGVTITSGDELVLTIKSARNGTTLVEKTFSDITNNTVNLELTEAESALLGVGRHVYSLDWYQDGAFLCNIIPLSEFRVVDKA